MAGSGPLRGVAVLELQCPRTGRLLGWTGTELSAPGTGYRYPVVDGIPVVFDDELAALYLTSVGTVHEYFRTIPPRYADEHRTASVGAAAFLPLLRNRLERTIRRDMDVLEVGAGTGFATKTLLELCDRVVATDASLEMLQVNRRAHPDTPMVCCPIERLPFPDEAFDVVFGNNVFYLVPDKAAGAREVARVLRPRGVCVMSELNPFHPLLPVAFTLKRWRFEHTIYDQTPSRIARRWGEHGMTLEEVDFFSYTPYFAGERLLKALSVFEKALGWSRLARRFSAIRIYYALRKAA